MPPSREHALCTPHECEYSPLTHSATYPFIEGPETGNAAKVAANLTKAEQNTTNLNL